MKKDALEISLEKWACDRFREAGADAVKRGQDGEPDREVFWGNGLHLWAEFKKEDGGRLTPAQKVWIKHKLPPGDELHLLDTKEEVLNLIEVWTKVHGPATALQHR